jgi:ATP-dependent DNA helicase RecQ
MDRAHNNRECVLEKCRDVFIVAFGMASSCLHSEECVESVANAVFKVPALRQEQVDVIAAILYGHNVIAVLPTGFGKSLCYQVGTMMLNGFTLVVTPLLALCEDQIAFMKAHNVPVVRVDSTLDHTSQKSVCERIMRDDCDVKAVYTTPETLKHNVRVVEALRVAGERGRVNFATIDEAHCVLDWSDFR